jgi:hypothetical protein
MKKSLRHLALLSFLISSLVACQKTSGFDEPPGNQYPPVFNNAQEAGEAVSHYFRQAGLGEQLLQVENVLYLESQNKTYALVFYQSSFGHSNILYEKDYQNLPAPTGKTYKCTGSACDCKVLTNISSQGDVSFSCSCSSCTMSVNEF